MESIFLQIQYSSGPILGLHIICMTYNHDKRHLFAYNNVHDSQKDDMGSKYTSFIFIFGKMYTKIIQ